jgi:excisionase family DNA binding protein
VGCRSWKKEHYLTAWLGRFQLLPRDAHPVGRSGALPRHGRYAGESLPKRELAKAAMSGPLLTADQVAKLLGVPASWVYEQSRKGSIPTVALGRYRRFRAEAIAEWVKEHEAASEIDAARRASRNRAARNGAEGARFSGRA